MFKKLIITGLVVLVGFVLLTKTSAGNKITGLAGLLWNKAGTALENQVPPETEIERIRHELAQRGNEMKKHISVIAEEMVAVENLKQEISITKGKLDKQRANIMTMKHDLEACGKDGTKTISYGDRTYSAARIREKLARDWASYKQCEESLKAREKLLEAKEAALVTAREQLAEMRAQYEQVEVELAQLETDIKSLRLAQTRSKFQLDDSHLSRIKEAKARLRDRVSTMKKLTALEGEFAHDLDIRIEKKLHTADVLKEIDEHFGKEEATNLVEGR